MADPGRPIIQGTDNDAADTPTTLTSSVLGTTFRSSATTFDGSGGIGLQGISGFEGVGVRGEANSFGTGVVGEGFVGGRLAGQNNGLEVSANDGHAVIAVSGSTISAAFLADSATQGYGLLSQTNGDKAGVLAQVLGNGPGVEVEIGSSFNPSTGIRTSTNGTGVAAAVFQNNAGSSAHGITASVAGTGAGLSAVSIKGVGVRAQGSKAALLLVPRAAAGRPTTGAHNRGELVVDNAGAMFLCTAAGTPGTWVRVSVTPPDRPYPRNPPSPGARAAARCSVSAARVAVALRPLVEGSTYVGHPPKGSGWKPAMARLSTPAR